MAKTIVFYFSATNTTKQRAEKIASKLGADLFAIQAEKPYSAADLDWHDPNSRTSIEQHQHASRVAIKDDLPAINDYDTVLIGFPIWWGIPPRLIVCRSMASSWLDLQLPAVLVLNAPKAIWNEPSRKTTLTFRFCQARF